MLRVSPVFKTWAVGLGILLVVSCGGATTPSSSEHYKIGQIASLTGAYQALGSNDRLGAQQAFDEINKSGGINGHQVDLLVEDDQTKPDQSVVAFNKLIGEGVIGMIGSSFTNAELATVPLAQKAKIPYVSTAATDHDILEGGKPGGAIIPNVFQTVPQVSVVGERLMQYMQAQGLSRMAVAHDTQNAFADAGTAAQKQIAAKYGITFVQDVTFESSTTDFTAQLTQVKNSPAQGLMVWATGPPATIITKQAKQLGLKIPLLFSHAQASTLYTKAVGPDGEGVIIASSAAVIGPSLPDSYPNKKLISAMAATFQQANGYYPPEFAFNAYAAAKVLAEAIRKANSTDSNKIVAQLSNLTLATAGGEFHFSDTNHWGLNLDWVAIDTDTGGNLVPTDFSKKQLEQVKSP